MSEHWSLDEVAATVADYFVMLEHELLHQPYSKTEHRAHLQAMLRNRSGPAIEFKHANISAVLIELGVPYIDGYKPRSNYQQLLKEEVVSQLNRNIAIINATRAIVDAPPPKSVEWKSLEEIFVPAPTPDRPRSVREPDGYAVTPTRINYLERETRNSLLGSAGERFALQVEHRRLWEAGCRTLADRIEHVAATQGDGLGYDILSFEITGQEKPIEVKTTAFGAMTPFFASANEMAASEVHARFSLYRVFKFRDAPRIFSLQGPLKAVCFLEPVQYRATPR